MSELYKAVDRLVTSEGDASGALKCGWLRGSVTSLQMEGGPSLPGHLHILGNQQGMVMLHKKYRMYVS